MAIIYLPK
jgi:hypothetical protein